MACRRRAEREWPAQNDALDAQAASNMAGAGAQARAVLPSDRAVTPLAKQSSLLKPSALTRMPSSLPLMAPAGSGVTLMPLKLILHRSRV